MNKSRLKIILKEMLLFLVQIAFSRLQFGLVLPVGFAFAMSRVFFGGSIFLISFEYVVSNLFLIKRFYLFSSIFFEVVILSLYYFSKEMFKIKKKKLILSLFLILSTMLKFYFSFSGKLEWSDYLVEIFAKVCSLFFFIKAYDVFQKKFIFLKCSNLDYSIFSVFVILFVLGLFKYQLLAKTLGLCLFLTTLLLSCRFLPIDKFLIFSLSLSLSFGYIFSSVRFVLLSLIFIILLTFISRIYKYLFLSVVLLFYLAILKYLDVFSISLSCSLLPSVLIMLIVPQKIINKLESFFEEKNLNIIQENEWNEKELEIKRNLNIMSKSLSKMQSDFKLLIVGKIDRKHASQELSLNVISKCCDGCERRNICDCSLIDKKNLLTEYIFFAINKGSFSIDEMSVGFKTYCHRTNVVAKEINLISKQFLSFETNLKSEDESKLLISTELGNFANLFKNFAKNIENSSKINKNLSLIAKEMLLNSMIDVRDVAVFESKDGIEKIDIVAENSLILRRELVEELSKIVRAKVQAKKINHLDFSGLSLASFVIARAIKAEFAISTSSKEDVCGDSCLISRIDDDRFFVAIADGMGHGKTASRTSKMILDLIKNLFSIGFDLEVIIDGINKLLLPVGLDNFSTLDVAIVDLKLEKCTFVKLGSSVTALKHSEKTEIIKCGSLPIGIVQNLRPTIIVKPIRAGDVIVLASDGVVDCFKDIDSYKIFVNDYKINDLQRFADNVIFELGMSENGKRDDMSIIALKILKNSIK